MTYPYLILPDGTEMVHSQVIDDMGVPTVYVYFERPTAQGFDEARCRLPGGDWYHHIGFSREELDYFSQLVRQNKPLIYKLAASGGRDLGKEKNPMDCETVTLRCDDNAEAIVFKKYNWAKGECDFEITVEDSYCGGKYMGIKGRFQRAWHAFFAKPIFLQRSILHGQKENAAVFGALPGAYTGSVIGGKLYAYCCRVFRRREKLLLQAESQCC